MATIETMTKQVWKATALTNRCIVSIVSNERTGFRAKTDIDRESQCLKPANSCVVSGTARTQIPPICEQLCRSLASHVLSHWPLVLTNVTNVNTIASIATQLTRVETKILQFLHKSNSISI